MNCDMELHESLIESGDIVCPFCDQNLEDTDEKPRDRLAEYYFCCDGQDIIKNDGMIVCRSCGIVQGYEIAREYIDYYENRHRIRRKSIYHRKYHLNNILMDISTEYNIIFSVEQRNNIMRIFIEIGKILHQINGERKRMISFKFILRQVLRMMGLPFNEIPISKSKKTLAFYQRYWTQIILLIGDRMKGIIYGGEKMIKISEKNQGLKKYSYIDNINGKTKL